MKKDKGMTLIALIVCVLIMLIVAGTSISGILQSGTISKAEEVAFKSEARDIKDAWETKIIGIDSTYLDYEDISKVLKDLKANPDIIKKLEIQNGKLVYKEDVCTEQEREWFESIGIFGSFSIIANVKTNVRILQKTVETVKRQATDVVFVLDISGSMKNSDDGVTRAEKMTSVLNSTMKEILSKSSENRIGLVTFDNDYATVLPLDHYNLLTEGKNFLRIEKIKYYSSGRTQTGYDIKTTDSMGTALISDSTGKGIKKTIQVRSEGTDIQIGLKEAYDLVNNRIDTKNLPAIILITDGVPNYYYCDMERNTISSNIKRLRVNSNSNPVLRGYHTILTFAQVKKNIKDLRIYNINIVDYENNIDRIFVELMLNPSNEIIRQAKEIKTGRASSSELNQMRADKLNEFGRKVENKINSNQTTNYFYTDGFSVGALSEKQLKDLLKEFVKDIESSLSKEITIGNDTNITGIFQLDSDNLTFKTTLGPNGKTEDDTDVPGTYYFNLDEEEEVRIKVKAAAFQDSPDGKSKPQIIEGTDVTTSKNMTIQSIKDGIEPNLYYIDGLIKWNVRSVYKDKEGLAKKAIDAVKLPSGNCSAQVVEVIIELPVTVRDFIPDAVSE